MAKKKKNHQEMTFLEHLEELRWHVIRALIAIIIAMIVVFSFIEIIIDKVVLAPLTANFFTNRMLCRLNEVMCFDSLGVTFQATAPMEQFSRAIMFSFFGGFIASFPYVVWEIWRFVRPGLERKESFITRWAVSVISFLFLTGVLFSYFMILPISFRFFAEFTLAEGVQNIWRIGDVIGMSVKFCFAGGLMFQLPVLAYVLSEAGIISPQLMRAYRKHALVFILVLAGLLTPPDVISQLLLGGPLFLLYQLSIVISARAQRRRAERRKEEERENESAD